MGKSPAKWIKGVLFGKKSTRSHGSKGRNTVATNDNGYNIGQGLHALAGSSPVISDPVLVSTVGNGIVPELERGATSNISKAVTLPTNLDIDNQGSAGTRASNDVEKLREEQAAIKAQTAFRGYLARKAYRALRGIIRLQALVRGHLVRRQAVATLRSMQGIVKIQALVRAQRVRRSGVGLEIYTKFGQRKAVDAIPSDTWKEKVATNAFICKLLSSSPVAIPLQVQYDEMEPNSVSNWLERWTSSHPQKTISQPKKNMDSKSHTKRGSYAMEIETGRPKRSVRRNPEFTSDPEKPKRNPRKVSSSPVESAREPQTELEKVKRNLRKVSSMMAEASNHPEVDIEKPNHSLRKMPNSKPSDESVEKVKEEHPLALDTKLELESSSKLVAVEEPVGALLDNGSPLESHPLQRIDKEENLDMTNVELSPKEERASHESQKTSKRRASFSVKTECADNDLQNTPPVPSYMAKTESSKAKFRGQNSPSFGSDSGDRNGLTRRHSLPSSANGKLSLQSPRTQKLVQASSKGSAKTDRSLLSSRDGNERPIQVDWKR